MSPSLVADSAANEASSLLPLAPDTPDNENDENTTNSPQMIVFTVGNVSDDESPVLLRHDSEFSVSSTYQDSSPNDLSVVQGAILLTAECLGTGLLALPGDIHVLGFYGGMAFLILQFPINFAAGTLLSLSASFVEEKQRVEDRLFQAALAAEEQSSTPSTQADYRALNQLTAESAFTIQTTQTDHAHLHHDTVSKEKMPRRGQWWQLLDRG